MKYFLMFSYNESYTLNLYKYIYIASDKGKSKTIREATRA